MLEDEQRPNRVGQRYKSVEPRVKSIRPLTEREELNMVDFGQKRSRIERIADQLGLDAKS